MHAHSVVIHICGSLILTYTYITFTRPTRTICPPFLRKVKQCSTQTEGPHHSPQELKTTSSHGTDPSGLHYFLTPLPAVSCMTWRHKKRMHDFILYPCTCNTILPTSLRTCVVQLIVTLAPTFVATASFASTMSYAMLEGGEGRELSEMHTPS